MTIFIEKSDFDSKMRNICVKREKIVHDKTCFNFFSITQDHYLLELWIVLYAFQIYLLF